MHTATMNNVSLLEASVNAQAAVTEKLGTVFSFVAPRAGSSAKAEASGSDCCGSNNYPSEPN